MGLFGRKASAPLPSHRLLLLKGLGKKLSRRFDLPAAHDDLDRIQYRLPASRRRSNDKFDLRLV